MKYLVNRETKEHRLYTEGDYNRLGHIHGKWDVVEADEEGWIPWEGGDCPLPDGHKYNFANTENPSRDINDVYSHPENNVWESDLAHCVTAYRPFIVAAESGEQQPKSILCPDFDFTGSGVMPYSAHSPSVFDRLKSAIAASESIPAIIAEIDALLPEGYCVAKRSTVNEAHIEGIGGITLTSLPAEDMSDWRNWREGDILEIVSKECGHEFEIGILVRVKQSTGYNFYCSGIDCPESWHVAPQEVRFHSRPAKVTE